MTQQIATYGVKIDPRQAVAGSKKVNKALMSMGNIAKKTTGAFLSLKTALPIAGFTLFTKSTLSSADALAKTASKLGITTDALQEFHHAAKLSGVQANTMEMALQRFTRRAAEAAKGTGEAKAALEQMGIQLTSGNGQLRSSEELLGDVANALQNTSSDAERLRLAFKLFDSEGVAMVNMLKDGKSGLEAMRKEARDLGLVLDEDLLKNAEKINDKFTRATAIIGVQFKTALLELAPVLMQTAGYLQDIGKFMKETFDTAKENKIANITTKLQEQADELDRLSRIKPFTDEMYEGVVADTIEARKEFEKLAKKLKEADKTISKIDLTKITGSESGKQLELVIERWSELNKELDRTVTTVDLTAPKLNELGDAGEEAADKTETAWQEAAEAMQSSMSDAITDGIMGMKSFGDVATSILNDVARQMVKTQISDPLSKELTSMLGDIGGGKGIGGLFSFDGGGFTGYGARSGGVDGRGGFPAILHPNETVVDHTKGQGQGQIVNVTYSPQVNALDPRTAAVVIAENAPTVVGIVQQAFNRNGRAVALA